MPRPKVQFNNAMVPIEGTETRGELSDDRSNENNAPEVTASPEETSGSAAGSPSISSNPASASSTRATSLSLTTRAAVRETGEDPDATEDEEGSNTAQGGGDFDATNDGDNSDTIAVADPSDEKGDEEDPDATESEEEPNATEGGTGSTDDEHADTSGEVDPDATEDEEEDQEDTSEPANYQNVWYNFGTVTQQRSLSNPVIPVPSLQESNRRYEDHDVHWGDGLQDDDADLNPRAPTPPKKRGNSDVTKPRKRVSPFDRDVAAYQRKIINAYGENASPDDLAKIWAHDAIQRGQHWPQLESLSKELRKVLGLGTKDGIKPNQVKIPAKESPKPWKTKISRSNSPKEPKPTGSVTLNIPKSRLQTLRAEEGQTVPEPSAGPEALATEASRLSLKRSSAIPEPSAPEPPVPEGPAKKKRRSAMAELESDLGEKWAPAFTEDGRRPVRRR
ncbi:hypothetical protein F5Y16DRAFT_362480 [Xylariaceae sp. FL0255]|nr:hypothetical protein F5Y16DRAFT_362480 [Xylariaceae sp. FL0255]